MANGHFVDIKRILFNIVSNAGQRWRHAWRLSSALFRRRYHFSPSIFHNPQQQHRGLTQYFRGTFLTDSWKFQTE